MSKNRTKKKGKKIEDKDFERAFETYPHFLFSKKRKKNLIQFNPRYIRKSSHIFDVNKIERTGVKQGQSEGEIEIVRGGRISHLIILAPINIKSSMRVIMCFAGKRIFQPGALLLSPPRSKLPQFTAARNF